MMWLKCKLSALIQYIEQNYHLFRKRPFVQKPPECPLFRGYTILTIKYLKFYFFILGWETLKQLSISWLSFIFKSNDWHLSFDKEAFLWPIFILFLRHPYKDIQQWSTKHTTKYIASTSKHTLRWNPAFVFQAGGSGRNISLSKTRSSPKRGICWAGWVCQHSKLLFSHQVYWKIIITDWKNENK